MIKYLNRKESFLCIENNKRKIENEKLTTIKKNHNNNKKSSV
jgi:hypothetical protein